VRYLLVLTAALVLVACENDRTQDFLGKWYKVSGQGSEYMSVEPHSDHILVLRPQALLPGEMETVPAKLEDRTLIIGSGAEEIDFWLDPKTHRLLSDSAQYARSNR
jgi:hypothetical protein